MSVYDAKYRTTLVARHRKSGGFWTGLPKEMIDQLRIAEGYQIEIAVIRTLPPPLPREIQRDVDQAEGHADHERRTK